MIYTQKLITLLDKHLSYELLYADRKPAIIRGRIIVFLLYLNMIVTLIGFLFALSGGFSGKSLFLGGWVAFISVAFSVIGLNILNSVSSFLWAVNLYGTGAFVSLFAGILITGGVHGSPAVPIIFLMPLFMYTLGGSKCGLFWSLLITLVALTLSVLQHHDVEFFNIFSSQQIEGFSAFLILTSGLIVAACIVSLNYINRDNEEEFSNLKASEERLLRQLKELGITQKEVFYHSLAEDITDTLNVEKVGVVMVVEVIYSQLMADSNKHEKLSQLVNILKHCVKHVDLITILDESNVAISVAMLDECRQAEDASQRIAAEIQAFNTNRANVNLLHASVGCVIYPPAKKDPQEMISLAQAAINN